MMYLVEGNIGAGKSTFLQLIKDQLPQLEVAFEPVQAWHTADHGKSLLQNFYSDTQRWAYTMESFTLIHRVFENTKLNPRAITLAERSIYSGFYCFAKNSYLNNHMSRLEWNIYKQLFDFLTSHNSYCKPTGFIYLQTDPAVAYERVIRRNRAAEKLISRSYMDQIHEKHESLLLEQASPITAPILVLDGNQNFEEDPAVFNQMSKQVQDFINTPHNQPTNSTSFNFASAVNHLRNS